MDNISFNIENCCGCTACKTACPCGAISMVLDARGFYVPVVDEKACIRCGKCLAVCPTLQLPSERSPLNGYACWHSDAEKRRISSSGGVFIGLAEAILQQKGVCFGAVYSGDCMEVHHASSDQVDYRKFCKSKYLQSDLRNCLAEALAVAESGRKVLFCGTPCACAGLAGLAKDAPNLYIVDFICGGVPSVKCYEQHLRHLSRKFGSAVVEVDFRSKDSGWKRQYLDLRFADGRKYHRHYLRDPFFSLFYKNHLSTNYICGNCPFRKRHVADITIADFWGYAKAGLKYDERGISLLLVNTRRGLDLFEKFVDKQSVELVPEQYSYALEPFAGNPAVERRKRAFFAELSEGDFYDIYPKYVNTSGLHMVLRRIRALIKRKLAKNGLFHKI